jgi:hypothetical protein
MGELEQKFYAFVNVDCLEIFEGEGDGKEDLVGKFEIVINLARCNDIVEVSLQSMVFLLCL